MFPRAAANHDGKEFCKHVALRRRQGKNRYVAFVLAFPKRHYGPPPSSTKHNSIPMGDSARTRAQYNTRETRNLCAACVKLDGEKLITNSIS